MKRLDHQVEVVNANVEASEARSKFIAQARNFLDKLENEPNTSLLSGVISVTYKPTQDQILADIPTSGLTERQRAVLVEEASEHVKASGMTVGDYDSTISNLVQLGLGMKVQALAQHRHTCDAGNECGINEETCLALPATDLLNEVLTTVMSDASIPIVGNVMTNLTKSLPLLRSLFLARVGKEDPEQFKRMTQDLGLDPDVMEKIRNGEPVSNEDMNGGTKVFAAKATPEMLQALLDSGAVPEEAKEEMRKHLEELMMSSPDTKPDEMSPTSTFVAGDAKRKH